MVGAIMEEMQGTKLDLGKLTMEGSLASLHWEDAKKRFIYGTRNR